MPLVFPSERLTRLPPSLAGAGAPPCVFTAGKGGHGSGALALRPRRGASSEGLLFCWRRYAGQVGRHLSSGTGDSRVGPAGTLPTRSPVLSLGGHPPGLRRGRAGVQAGTELHLQTELLAHPSPWGPWGSRRGGRRGARTLSRGARTPSRGVEPAEDFLQALGGLCGPCAWGRQAVCPRLASGQNAPVLTGWQLVNAELCTAPVSPAASVQLPHMSAGGRL